MQIKYLLFLVFAFVDPAHAASWEDSKGCPEAATQSELNACAARAWKQADETLARVEAEYAARLDAEQVVLFRSAQSAWRKYREADCKFEASAVEGGSAYPMVFASCMEEKAEVRTAELDKLARCEEGDLSCPVGAD